MQPTPTNLQCAAHLGSYERFKEVFAFIGRGRLEGALQVRLRCCAMGAPAAVQWERAYCHSSKTRG